MAPCMVRMPQYFVDGVILWSSRQSGLGSCAHVPPCLTILRPRHRVLVLLRSDSTGLQASSATRSAPTLSQRTTNLWLLFHISILVILENALLVLVVGSSMLGDHTCYSKLHCN
eukprot:Gb_08007 [translate_table: standard]